MTGRLLALLALLLALPAAAQQGFPPAVQQALAGLERDCPGARFGPRFLRVANFSPDNRPDYVLDYQHVECPGEDRNGYCGTGGCGVQVLVSEGDAYRTAFDETLGAYRVMRRRAGDALVITRHGADCRPGVPRCRLALVYRNGRFERRRP